MRPRCLIPLLLLCAVAAAQPIVEPPFLPAIDAPEESSIGELVVLTAPAGTGHQWVTVPKYQQFQARGAEAFFTSKTEQRVTFVCAYLDDTGGLVMCRHVLTIGEPPNPPPPPPVPGKLVAVVVIEETDANLPEGRTPEQAAIVLDKGWRKTLDDAKIKWRMIDDDVTTEADQMPPDLKQAIAAGRSHGLPVVVCLGDGGRVLSVEGLPTETFTLPDGSEETRPTVEAMRAMIEGKVK